MPKPSLTPWTDAHRANMADMKAKKAAGAQQMDQAGMNTRVMLPVLEAWSATVAAEMDNGQNPMNVATALECTIANIVISTVTSLFGGDASDPETADNCLNMMQNIMAEIGPRLGRAPPADQYSGTWIDTETGSA